MGKECHPMVMGKECHPMGGWPCPMREAEDVCVCVRVCDASPIAARAQEAHATRQMLAALSAGACAGALAHIEANGLALWWCGWERWMRAVGRSGGLAFCSLMHPGAVSASSLLSPWMPMV